MSSSSKKKLRRDEVAAKNAKKQQTANKESKKMKLYTGIFFVVLALMVAIVIVAVVDNSGIVDRHTTAVKIGNESVSSVEMNMYFREAINSFYSSNYNYLSLYGLDAYTSLDSQKSTDGSTSWADYFIKQAKDDIHFNYAVYNAAIEAGYTLSAEDQATLDNVMDQLEETAVSKGYKNANDYLSSFYGTGSTADIYRHSQEVMAVATDYQKDYQQSLLDAVTADQIAARDAEDPIANNLYSYNYYIMYASNYLEGGTEDENGNITYSDEENAAALAACEADAKSIVESGADSIDAFNAAISALDNIEDMTYQTSSANENIRSTSIVSLVRDWVTDPARQPGDMTYVARTTNNSDGTTTVAGYNVVFFTGSSDNDFPLVNVRHLLIGFEGGTYNSSTGETTYSTVEKAAAKEKAQALYDAWVSAGADEDAFIQLANENSTDPGSNTNGGMYEDIYPGEMVDAFNDWCYDASRQIGDYDMIETEYGYHIMYFSGYSDTTYRDYIIRSDIVTEQLSAWQSELLEKYPVVDVNLKRIKTNISLYSLYANG